MATRNFTLKRKVNNTTYDILHPKTTWAQVEGKPSTFTPTGHSLDSHSGLLSISKLSIGADGQVIKMVSGVPTWASGGGGESYSYSSYFDSIGEHDGTKQFTVSLNTKFVEVTLHRGGLVRGRIFLSIGDFVANSWMGQVDISGVGAIAYIGSRTFEVENASDSTYVSWTEHRWG